MQTGCLYLTFTLSAFIAIEKKGVLSSTTEQLILEAGNQFSYPDNYTIQPITEQINYTQSSWPRIYELPGFHFADVIGYIITNNVKECMQACIVFAQCMAFNYVKTNHWCVFTTTAHKSNVTMWNHVDVQSNHTYFTEGPKSGVQEHKRKNDGAGLSLMPGVVQQRENFHNHPWTVRINECSGILVPKLMENAIQNNSDLIVTSIQCVITINNTWFLPMVQFGSYSDDIIDDTEVQVPVSKIIIPYAYISTPFGNDIALLQLQHPVEFNSYMRPIGVPDRAQPSKPEMCQTAGWPSAHSRKDGELSVLKTTNVNVTYDNDCNGKYANHSFIKNNKLCAQSTSQISEEACAGNTGSPLICPESAESGEIVWTFYGMQSSSIGCPAMYTNVYGRLPWLKEAAGIIGAYKENNVYGLWIISRPIETNDSNDEAARLIRETGQDFTYSPQPYILNPIDHDLISLNVSRARYQPVHGFSFADVINYTKTSDLQECMDACTIFEPCMAVNYVENNSWCVFLKSAHLNYNATRLWGEKELSVKHAFFITGAKANVTVHKPRNDGAGIHHKPGTIPLKYKGVRMVGAAEFSKPYSLPWIVRVRLSTNFMKFSCSGSLLPMNLADSNDTSSDLVITAAHCIINRTTLVMTPAKNVSVTLATYREDMVEDTEQTVQVIRLISHLHYNNHTLVNDIALIQLERPVEFNNYIQPINLPLNQAKPSNPDECKVAGWGAFNASDNKMQSNKLKEATFRILSESDCFDSSKLVGQGYNSSSSSWAGTVLNFTRDNQFCAIHTGEGKASTCQGDSGGPLSCRESIDGESVHTLFGIISCVSSNNCLEKPPVFTNVSILIPWIQKAANEISKKSLYSHSKI